MMPLASKHGILIIDGVSPPRRRGGLLNARNHYMSRRCLLRRHDVSFFHGQPYPEGIKMFIEKTKAFQHDPSGIE